jgi:hypothetical protein
MTKTLPPDAARANEPIAGAEPPPDQDVVTLDDVQEVESTLAALDSIEQAALPEEPARQAPAEREPEPEPPCAAAPVAEGAAPPASAPAPDVAAAPAPADERDAEIARLQDRISELRIAAGRSGEVRARLEAELAAASRERDEARRRVVELERQLVNHEQRVVKAYQRLKGDEQVRERTRRALAIALQLLDESGVRAAAKGEG